jgi:hypothetical protein
MSPDAERIHDESLLVARAFNAKKSYFDGLPGPYVLAGQYSLATFERFSGMTENHWRMAYSHEGNQIILYGDPQPEHNLFSSNIRNSLLFHLAAYIGAADAPPSGIPSFDDDVDEPPFERCLKMMDDLGSGRRSLVPRWTQHGRTRHPTDHTRDGTIDKEADERITVRGKYSATGRPIDLMVIELALDNETLAETAWECQLWVSAQIPAKICLAIKVDVSFSIGSCLIGVSDLVAENRKERRRSHMTPTLPASWAIPTTICRLTQ